MAWSDVSRQRRQLAVEVLTANQLRVLKLRMDDHTWAAIAVAMNRDEATCRGHYRRALRNLADAERRRREVA